LYLNNTHFCLEIDGGTENYLNKKESAFFTLNLVDVID